MLDTSHQNIKVDQEDVKDKAEDMTNKEEFVIKSKPAIQSTPTPEIPQKNGL